MTAFAPAEQQMQALAQEYLSGYNGQYPEETERKILALLATPEARALPYARLNFPFVTSHKLQEFAECAYFTWLKHVQLVEPPATEDKKDHFVVGLALDDLLTKGRAEYEKAYVTVDTRENDIDAKIEVCKARISEAQQDVKKNGTRSQTGIKAEEAARERIAALESLRGKIQLTRSMSEEAENAAAELLSRHFFPKQIGKRVLLCVSHGSILKGEPDAWNEERNRPADVKSCANIVTFCEEMRPGKFFYEKYLAQLATYSYIHEVRHGERPNGGELYVADKWNWSRSIKFVFTPETLRGYYHTLEENLQKYRDCRESGIWPMVNLETEQGREIFFNSPYYPMLDDFKKQIPDIVL